MEQDLISSQNTTQEQEDSLFAAQNKDQTAFFDTLSDKNETNKEETPSTQKENKEERTEEKSAAKTEKSATDFSSPSFAAKEPAKPTPYQVLARKYRPKTFNDLIGQETLVRTLSNAIETNHLAQAYILTGIQGTGKTTSARLIAKALNCVGPDGKGGMTITPCGQCAHCLNIASDSDMDVTEIDAASNTGVDNIREIIEGARYNPISARYKIYIIDEVHMLSKPAFNALLKTLEEPPERVKFIFATTEIRKVPITVLSRCQRFDLRRIEPDTLADFFETVLQKENRKADPEAVKLIAKAADGSVRDGLSLLDRALAHADKGETITAEQVRSMIGLADKSSLFTLFDHLMKGEILQALDVLTEQYSLGVDPTTLVQDLLSLTHWLTRVKIAPELVSDPSLTDLEKNKGLQMSQNLTMGTLTQVWQMLLKGLSELKSSFSPIKTVEMLFIRIGYSSGLPSVSSLVEEIKKKSVTPQKTTETEPSLPQKTAEKESVPDKTGFNVPPKEPTKKEELLKNEEKSENVFLSSLSEMTDFLRKNGKLMLAFKVESFLHPIYFAQGTLEYQLTQEADRSFIPELKNFLEQKTGVSWTFQENTSVQAKKTLKEEKQQKENTLKKTLAQNETVKAVLSSFTGTQIDNIRPRELEEAPSTDLMTDNSDSDDFSFGGSSDSDVEEENDS
jgi:DNA polymerase III subunit gamma/tau